ncbi:MAG: radical SAM protein [bacterium]
MSWSQTRNRLALSWAYLRGDPDPGGWPMELTVELTNRCDLGCIMCPRNWSGRRVGDMDLGLFRRIVDQAAGRVGMVDLCLAGESLLHPGIFDAIAHLRANGIRSYLQTSGLHVDAERAARLVESGLDFVSFSIDGFRADTYAAIRRGGDFARTVANLEAFLELRRRAGRGPFTVVQMIVQRENAEETESFREHWRKSGVDAVRLKPLGVNREHVRKIGDRVVGPPPSSSASPCIRTWRGLAVYWDGRVVPCCYDFDGCETVGDLNVDSLDLVWRGGSMRSLRLKQAQGRYDEIPLCKDCNRKNLNVSRAVAGVGSALGDPGLVLRSLSPLSRLGIRP